jgi:excinuclease ABC subunit C
MFPFKDIKSNDVRHNSFYEALGRSPKGEDENSKRRYQRTISNLILFFEGKKKQLQVKLTKEMNAHAKKMEFEDAQKIKRLIYSLDHVNDMALIKQDGNGEISKEGKMITSNFRIEAYDIAHLSGTNVVGAFTVMVDGEFARDQYRKFNISKQQNNDIAGLVEILNRRLNHTEWTYPDLVVVDGGEGQLNAAQDVLKARRINIPVVAVTKDERHKASQIIGNSDSVNKYKEQIIKINAECHRYVIKFHRNKRDIIFR